MSVPREVVNANTRTARQPLPEMSGALTNWQNTMTFSKITKTMVNDEVVDNKVDYYFEGVFEPMTPQALFFKPEGERNWKWWTLWTRIGLDIQNQDLIQDFNGLIYKVIKRTDWTQGNYTEFEVIQDFTKTT